MNQHLDAEDQDILARRIQSRDVFAGARIGDYVIFASGELERLSHDWGESMQTSPGGSFYLPGSGIGSLSNGGLHPAIPSESLELTPAILPGWFWFFHNGRAGAGRGVDVEIPCRVFKTKAPYAGYLAKDWQSSRIAELRLALASQLLS